MDVNITKKDPLNGRHGRFYEADWIPKRETPIILIVMNEETSEHEALWYLTFKSHPHIVHTFDFVGNDDRLPMSLQERATHGNLQILLQSKHFQPSANVLIAIFLQILDAMIYITNQGIVHGDLRCENVLVFQMNSSNASENVVKLTNFSMAGAKNSPYIDHRPTAISVRYCPPEILKNTDEINYTLPAPKRS